MIKVIKVFGAITYVERVELPIFPTNLYR